MEVTMWDKFLDLLTKSVIMQSLLTVLVVGAWLYLIVMEKPVPALLETIVGVVVGFFFGSKVTQGLNSMRK
jgi:xanthosine utilization system XapX-like protein